ncbi:squalene/phytoene synthase family protein [Ureibacillus sp. 179-F W5.1 NHS]|uniref:Phytoene/squalene synthase family protein n=1 Tax=Lysinibacillus halotolerans TaxID=1368476 RepID=A0A3M8HEC2_9BACI|nr:phytoene/squalene synthase family protein [Lysinibacillus halotolerans]RND00798.1 phytoene/squalene synthase family protein [Lysinibacillus halotolerans]
MNDKELLKDAMRVLKETSRTFYIPITFLQKELKTAVATAYLMMRAIDEIEDNEHAEVSNELKYAMLADVSVLLKEKTFNEEKYLEILRPVKDFMPEVTLRLADWIRLIPAGAEQIVKDATSEMADGMGKWSKSNFQVRTKEDLDEYTYYVAGLVGVMLSELWEWNAGIKTDRELAIGYGRGLQLVNILRNQQEDMEERGVSFVPEGWTRNDLFAYAEENLEKADLYMKDIHKRSILLFCRLPLALAHKTLKAMKNGQEKMTREEVERTVKEVQAD